ncbi:MAG: substrate-binding domain-containing protein, partial [Planctomycetota bacterium]
LRSRTPERSGLRVPEQAAWFQSAEAPTAYVCYNDHTAMELIQDLHEQGIRVPQDVSAVGADDMYECRLFAPALTTVHVPFEEMGERAAQILLSRISGVDFPRERTVLPEQVVIRRSTGPPPGD